MDQTFRRRRHTKLGSGFSDSVLKEFSTHSSASERAGAFSLLKPILAISVLCLGMFLLVGKLFYLTVVNGAYYRQVSESNRIREVIIPASRGVLYSRDGEVLASNRPIYRTCTRSVVDGLEKESCQIIPRETGIEKEAKGETVTVSLGREYPKGELEAHTVGYLAEITEEQLREKNAAIRKVLGLGSDDFCQTCYQPGDFIGATGLEEAFENELRGIAGKRLIEVDSAEQELKELVRIEPIAGKNLYTALDSDLQKRASEVAAKTAADPLINPKGIVIVASKPQTGEVLSLYSYPSFDPNAFVGQDRSDVPDVVDIVTDPRQPLFNRALSGLYPPGSTFKIITAASGLEEGVLDASTLIEDTGVITVGAFSFSNWYFTQYGSKEGEIDIARALARSNDIFFYKVGEWVGIEKLDNWGKKFQLQSVVPVEVSGGVAGLVKRDRKWYLGDTYHAAIGQGDVLATPLHVGVWSQIIANDGIYCPPTLLKKDPPLTGETFMPDKKECFPIELSDKTTQLIAEGMKNACSTGGTAWPLFNFSVNTASDSAITRTFTIDNKNFIQKENGNIGVNLACKTGTAEFGHPEHKTHAWLTAYAPLEDPEIVVTVLVEEGGEGSSVAGPLVKEILQEWFSKERQ